MTASTNSKRNWFRFSLSGMMLCVACFAAGVASERRYDHWTDARSAASLQRSLAIRRDKIANLNTEKQKIVNDITQKKQDAVITPELRSQIRKLQRFQNIEFEISLLQQELDYVLGHCSIAEGDVTLFK